MRSTRLPLHAHRCLRAVEDALANVGLAGEPALLAVSGGSDSMALLELVSLLAPRLDLTLHVAWIDHRLRASSPAEGEVVRAAAQVRGAVFHGEAIDPGAGDEDSMRRARHDALARVAAANGCRFVLLGHTADDQIETVMFRFLRGAGFGGLSGMRAARPPLLRPLLGLRREALRRFLVERGVAWVEDATNLQWRYARGRLRRTVLPAVEAAFGPGALDHLLDQSRQWREDEDFLEQEAERTLAYASRRGREGVQLDLEALAAAPPALKTRALRRWLAGRTGHTCGSRETAGLLRWLASAGEGEGVDLAGVRVERRSGRLVAVATAATECADGGGEGVLPPSGARVRVPGV
jgi:tRNA(Ile)-lysidine synthase